jgi:hypothetical protein
MLSGDRQRCEFCLRIEYNCITGLYCNQQLDMALILIEKR